jgi:hypothetical protein
VEWSSVGSISVFWIWDQKWCSWDRRARISEFLFFFFFNIGGTSSTVTLFIYFQESDWNSSILLTLCSLEFRCVYVFIYILLECVRCYFCGGCVGLYAFSQISDALILNIISVYFCAIQMKDLLALLWWFIDCLMRLLLHRAFRWFNYFHTPTYALVSYIIKPALIIYIKHFIHL